MNTRGEFDAGQLHLRGVLRSGHVADQGDQPEKSNCSRFHDSVLTRQYKLWKGFRHKKCPPKRAFQSSCQELLLGFYYWAVEAFASAFSAAAAFLAAFFSAAAAFLAAFFSAAAAFFSAAAAFLSTLAGAEASATGAVAVPAAAASVFGAALAGAGVAAKEPAAKRPATKSA